MMVVLMRKPPEGLQGNDAEMARCDALFLVGQEQPQRRSGIIAATEPASRVRTICRCKSYLRRAVMGKVGGRAATLQEDERRRGSLRMPFSTASSTRSVRGQRARASSLDLGQATR